MTSLALRLAVMALPAFGEAQYMIADRRLSK